MTTEDNKALVRRWFEEVVSQGKLALADELLGDPDYVIHFPGSPDPIGQEGHKQLVAMFRTGFPDWREVVEDMIAEGDRVVSATGYGTHEGEFQGIPPTGKKVTVAGIGIDRVAEDKIVEKWAAFDALGMMQQLGAIPTPEQAT